MDSFKSKDAFLEGKKIVLALSGGIDSIVLLHYLHAHYPNNLRAVHCNHHLSKHCTEWATFCQTQCQTLNIPYTNIDLYLEKCSNIEENARKKRYHALSCNLQENEILCTAHHQNDQAETLLLQLFRGSGVAGLASMPTLKPFGKGQHYRPLLNTGKSTILKYAQNNRLSWIEDDSNTDTRFRRNFLRLDIIPKLETTYKNLTQLLARSAKHQSEALQLTQDLAKIDMATHQIINNNRLNTVHLIKLNPYRIKNIIRYHLIGLKFLPPSDKVMQQILELLSAKQDTNPMVSWGNFVVRRYRNELYFINTQVPTQSSDCPYFAEFKDADSFSIRYRNAGQHIKLPNKTHTQSLKKVLQEAGIPPWERNTLKMYYIADELRAMERIGYMAHAE
ncbi:tRNA(Ile)-lysidine synthetase [Bathymodiolus thermophilus thioautotrophic gill symbiont]|uniref:tRNA lysidine(34) synthetase TilS n=1 Tax=Bathymodiolus thermophilus thioautotrophic gill symbiont TaxID=2360 RepID=UPI0010B3FD3F|nr:tRNA lysidine(34) synthetase TilS [Bathymodiolus thermophilus thioautotrophic gill symbiont]SHA12017.1 tRNA(Ile)-lysidine synthetase [Bathymodiolus thermophilus thioautotrophic gill symbiont]